MVVELLVFFMILLIVAIFSGLIGKLPISFQMIFIVAGMFVGWLVTGYVDVTQASIFHHNLFDSRDSSGSSSFQ